MVKLAELVRSKILREQRKRSRRGVPLQKNMTLVSADGNRYEPVIAGPSTIAPDCASAEALRGALEILKKITADSYVEHDIRLYEEGLRRFGDRWCYADISTVLYGICKRIEVESYLEIGVRRGRSMAIVAGVHADAAIVGFDLWIPNYVGIENPGPAFVQNELERVGYARQATLISGNSRVTVPQYFRSHPDAYFDIITVDGDHSARGAAIDLRNVMSRVKIGGFLVFDDIVNPWHPHLARVWRRIVERSGRFLTYRFNEVGYGIAVGIRQY